MKLSVRIKGALIAALLLSSTAGSPAGIDSPNGSTLWQSLRANMDIGGAGHIFKRGEINFRIF